jgi:hypothetical protein
MPVTRRTVLERLAVATDATRGETTTIEALAVTLDVDERTVKSHLNGLEACELARVAADGETRVTVTGEELLALHTEDPIVVDPGSANSGEREGRHLSGERVISNHMEMDG